MLTGETDQAVSVRKLVANRGYSRSLVVGEWKRRGPLKNTNPQAEAPDLR